MWVGVVIAACGGGSPGSVDAGVLDGSGTADGAPLDDGGRHPTEAETKLDAYVRALCDQDARCEHRGNLYDNADCDPVRAAWVPAAVASVDAGRARLSDDIDVCLAFLAASCGPALPGHSPCTTLITGLVADGEPCAAHHECADDGICASAGGCPKRCRRRYLADEACWGLLTTCEAGSICVVTSLSDLSVRACTPLYAPLGSACSTEEPCEPPLLCHDVCVAPQAHGEPCTVALDGTHDCDGELLCAEGMCVDGEEVGEGGPCTPGGDRCPIGLVCSDAATCEVAKAIGDRCVDRGCGPYARCAAGVCTRIARLGEPCGDDIALCPRELICNDGTGTCTPHLGAGEACARDDECGLGFCISGVCTLRPLGGRCTTDAQCGEGVCLDEVCGPGFSVGEPCWRGNECADSLECRDDAETVGRCQLACAPVD